jgi:hypothetical protein
VGTLHAADAVTSTSLRADLANERATTGRLRQELEVCRRRLAEEFGRGVAVEVTGTGLTDWQAVASDSQSEKRLPMSHAGSRNLGVVDRGPARRDERHVLGRDDLSRRR